MHVEVAFADNTLHGAEAARELQVCFAQSHLDVDVVAISQIGEGEKQVAQLLLALNVVACLDHLIQFLVRLGQSL